MLAPIQHIPRKQAQRQYKSAQGMRLRWLVAEPRMVAVFKKLFIEWNVAEIEVVYISALL